MENVKVEPNENKTIWQRMGSGLTPYRIAGAVLFTLFAGADISLYFFGKDATGSVILAVIITLLSGAGALIWKYLRDHEDANETQRSIAMTMIVLHAIAAAIFLIGNFAKGGWEVLADKFTIDGVLAKEYIDYQTMAEKTFIWTIGVMLLANMIAHFGFQENDTEKRQKRQLTKITRSIKDAEIAALESESQKAADEYLKHAQSFAQLRGLQTARQRIVGENEAKPLENRLPAEIVNNMLAPIDEQIAKITGLIPLAPTSANTSEAAPFRQPSSGTK